ncbi:MAG: hypothetical protein ABSF50_04320 [Burkholderiaceae bacterium]|jgi:hypothetical protein
MKPIRNCFWAGLILTAAFFTSPSFAQGHKPVAQLETMTIVGHRTPANAAEPGLTSAEAARAPAQRLETMVIVGHREAIATDPKFARVGDTNPQPSRAYPL